MRKSILLLFSVVGALLWLPRQTNIPPFKVHICFQILQCGIFCSPSPWNLHDFLLLLICLLVLLYGIWDSALFRTADYVLFFSKASSCLMQGLASGNYSKSTYWIVLKGILLQNNLVKAFLYLPLPPKMNEMNHVSNNKNSIHFLETLQLLSIFLWHWISKERKLSGKPK